MKERKLWFLAQSLCLLVLMLINTSDISGQGNCLNDNGGFEEVIANCPNGNAVCFPGAFNNACLSNWRAANGSPDICTHPSNTAPPNGMEYYARMLTGHYGTPDICRNEAIFSPMELTAGNSYTLSFYHKTASKGGLEPISVKVYQAGDIENVISTGVDPCTNLEIPAGSELIYSSDNFLTANWIYESICFTAIDDEKFGILFVPEAGSNNNYTQSWLVDNVCVVENEICEATRSLTSCPDEDDYGYVVYDDCIGDFNWEFPAGSTAQEYTSYGFSGILHASPGIYNVTITYDTGCSVEQSWEIFNTCCDTSIPCPVPTGLVCEKSSEGFLLKWDEIQNIQQYMVNIFAFDPSCQCDDSQVPYQYSIPAFTNQIVFDNPDVYCFSWTVSTICNDDSYSEPSEPLCFNYLFQDCFEPGQ